MSLVRVSSNAHWYDKDGNAVHEVPMTSKGKEGNMRSTTVRDARKLGLFPSVTTIMKILAKDFLVAWKVEQAILSSLTLPRVVGESVDDFARRVVDDSEQQAANAAKIGSLLHDAIERYVTLKKRSDDPMIDRLMGPFIEWWDKNCIRVHFCEMPVVGDQYAGRIDCKAEIADLGLCMIDFKGRKQDKTGRFVVYDDDKMQLAAYRDADSIYREKAQTCISILLNNLPDGEPKVHVHVWGDDEIEEMSEAFQVLKKLWCLLKKYTPPTR